MEVVSSKNVFVNSESARTGDGQNLHLLFPPDAFSTNHKDELMRLTLTSFTMRRNFYSINKYNNVFYKGSSVGTVDTNTTIYTIEEGDYLLMSNLQTALQEALQTGKKDGQVQQTTTTCAIDNITRKIILTNVSVSSGEVFWSGSDMDTHEILGGTPNELFVVNSTTATGKFVVQADSISDVYLRTNLQSNNFISKKENNHLGNIDIFARIPLYGNIGGQDILAKTNVVKWEDSNDLYSIYIPNHQLSNVVFHLTDDKMRPLPMSDAQAAAHNINFKLTFRFDIMRRKNEMPPFPLNPVKDQFDRVDLRTDINRFR